MYIDLNEFEFGWGGGYGSWLENSAGNGFWGYFFEKDDDGYSKNRETFKYLKYRI